MRFLTALTRGTRVLTTTSRIGQFQQVRWCSDITEPQGRPQRTEGIVGGDQKSEPVRTPNQDRDKMATNDFFIGGGSPVNKVAGACCYALREYESAGMRAIGSRAVNQAIKASAVARTFMERENKGIIGRIENARVVAYERTTQTMPKLGAHILLYNNDEVLSVKEREDERILTVAARTLPRNLAAAIKQNIAGGRNVTVRGVGAEAVENGALGIGFARNYCKQDEECDFDIGYVAEFTNLGENITGISMMLIKLPPVAKEGDYE
eukprot:TRINITY_DN20473_c0_g1_i1.p1 TRINITY_DN20473_c0_g1~~TRINITY_DN20473_c0_g1_i1.p1  ORF type:complete len:265 (+),score=39.06 TRINITY_DN20473_c0_g1_i1:115-909(+)